MKYDGLQLTEPGPVHLAFDHLLCRVPKKYKRRTEINWFGMLAYIFFFCAFGFYLWIRITKTLDLGLYVGAQHVAASFTSWAKKLSSCC